MKSKPGKRPGKPKANKARSGGEPGRKAQNPGRSAAPRKPGSAAGDAARRGGPQRPKTRQSSSQGAGTRRAGVQSSQRGNRLWLYGTHAVRAALANPERRIHRLLATQEAAESLREDGLTGEPPIELLPRDLLAQVLPEGAVHQGLAALVSPLPTRDMGTILAGALPSGTTGDPTKAQGRQVLLVLDQVTDPQNCGAVLRSAAAFGAAAVISPAHHAAPESGALAKAASGALELVPRVEVGNLSQALRQLKAGGYWILGLAEEESKPLAKAPEDDYGPRVVLVLGAEGRGLRRLTRENCDALVRLPTRPTLPSLNVSNAAAVALYALLCP